MNGAWLNYLALGVVGFVGAVAIAASLIATAEIMLRWYRKSGR